MQLKELMLPLPVLERTHGPGGRMRSDAGKLKILVVDDELLIAFFLGYFLEERGYNVRWTVFSNEALSLVRQETFDVILSDVSMRPVNGIELIRELRKRDGNCKVLMMSAFVERAKMEEQMKELDVSAFLEKPFDLELLRQIVRETTNEVQQTGV